MTRTAKNPSGITLTSFTDTVTLSGHVEGFASTNLTIGIGTGTWDFPMFAWCHDARTQVIYPASELGGAGTLTSLALEVTTPPGQILQNWTLRLKHTSLAEYPSSPQWEGSGWTVVYQGDEPAGTTGWRTFEFSTPFEYNGSDNLLVDFSFNNASTSSGGQCRSTYQDVPRSVCFLSDSWDGDPLSWSGTTPYPILDWTVPNLVLGMRRGSVVPVSVTPATAGPFVNGVWEGRVTVSELVTNMFLRADDGAGHIGESSPVDVQPAPSEPMLVMHDNPFSFTNGCYGFTVQGSAGQVAVIEASTDLISWLPIHTNLMGDLGECLFYDLHTGQFPRRYYRAKLHEGELPSPSMLPDSCGVAGAHFRVGVGAVGGQEVIVEASTNLVDWTPILTNTAGIGPLHFNDADMANFNQRFYRAAAR